MIFRPPSLYSFLFPSSPKPLSAAPLRPSGLSNFALIFLLTLTATSQLIFTSQLIALPYNFHISQGDIHYHELHSEHFHVYFDSRVPQEGLLMGHALEEVKPLMELWLGQSRGDHRPLKVVSSPVTHNASFANFIFDAIELQTSGQSIRDLAWHEYTHTLTYEHYRNFLSPPGSIFHILWMPAWLLEGLAEALSVSIGSDYQSGVERWHALSGNWPSYDRLHSLYLNAQWSARGYATSGAFVSWMIRELHLRFPQRKTSVSQLLQYFRRQTMPWMLPFNLFMPIGRTLKKALDRNGSQLYADYKRQAQSYWQTASPFPLLTSSAPTLRLQLSSGSYGISTDANTFTLITAQSRNITHQPLVFDEKGWATGLQDPLPPSASLPNGTYHTRLLTTDLKASITTLPSRAYTQRKAVVVSLRAPGKSSDFLPSRTLYKGYNIFQLFEGPQHLGWMERSLEHGLRLCQVPKKLLKKIASSKTPQIQPLCHNLGKGVFSSKPLGMRQTNRSPQLSPLTSEIWVRVEESTVSGDRYRIFVWNDATGTLSKRPWHPLAKPIQVAFSMKDTWVLTSDRSRTYIARVNQNSTCLEVMHLSDFVLGIWALPSGELLLKLFEGFKTSLIKIHPEQRTKYNCPTPEPHSSPLLEGMRILIAKKHSLDHNYLHSSRMPSLEEVVQRTHPWKIRYFGESLARTLQHNHTSSTLHKKKLQRYGHYSSDKIRDFYHHYRSLTAKVLSHKERHQALLKTPHLLNKNPFSLKVPLSQKSIKPYSFRWSSPVFFPWLGPHDALAQVGLISIPLVDDLQNHILRGTLLFGLSSQYPAVQLNYRNTRYSTPWDVNFFKQLTYNGFLKDYGSYYFDETGAQISASKSYSLPLPYLYFSASMGAKISYLDPYKMESYTGNYRGPSGLKNEPFLALSLVQRFPSWGSSLGLSGTLISAPGFLNEDRFDFHKLRYSAQLNQSLLGISTLKLSVKYGQTRGKRMLLFRELYSSMTTFIPGLGNATSFEFPIMGSGHLFRLSFGDSFLRHSAVLTTPLFSDLDTQIWILYAERLNWKLITHYGGAWNSLLGESYNTRPFLWAYATTLDLHLENKGVQFYVGLGLGKLHRTPYNTSSSYDAYANFGFQAFF